MERPAVLEAGSLRLDPGSRAVARDEVTIDVTAREFAVLEYLMRHRDLVVSKRDILGGVRVIVEALVAERQLIQVLEDVFSSSL